MKKLYIQPKSETFCIETHSMLANSLESLEVDPTKQGVEATNKKNLWGRENLWY